jgi:hypothetical protein
VAPLFPCCTFMTCPPNLRRPARPSSHLVPQSGACRLAAAAASAHHRGNARDERRSTNCSSPRRNGFVSAVATHTPLPCWVKTGNALTEQNISA